MNRLPYPSSDLDLYVKHDLALSIAEWLQSIDYKYTPRQSQSPIISLAMTEVVAVPHVNSVHFIEPQSLSYFGRGVACVLNFKKADRKIQLITCYHSPIEVILNFHSSE